MLADVFADVPHTEHDRGALAGEGRALLDVLVETSLVTSKREARQFLESGAVSVNGEKAELESPPAQRGPAPWQGGAAQARQEELADGCSKWK